MEWKCSYCEGTHPPLTLKEAAEIETKIQSDHIPDLEEVVHNTVKLVTTLQRQSKCYDDEALKKSLLERLDACFCTDVGQYPECARCLKIRELLRLIGVDA